jgi:WD40 repeat protein
VANSAQDAFSPNGEFLLIGTGVGIIEVRRTTDWEIFNVLPDHNHAILKLEFLPAGDQLLSIDGNGKLVLWSFPDFTVQTKATTEDDIQTSFFISPAVSFVVTRGDTEDGYVFCGLSRMVAW